MDPFSGSWFGLGIALGFIAACIAAWAALKLRAMCEPATTSWEQVPTRGYNTLAASSIASKANAGLPYRVTDTDMMADNRKGAVPLAQTPPRPMTPPGAGTPKREVSIVVAATAQPEPAPPPSATGAGHKRAISTASMYDVTDLDDDWTELLQQVDGKLMAQNQAPMTQAERAVAVRKLVAVTATRGVEGAISAAVEELLRVRSWNAAQRS